ncbi:hypothetical protein FRC02_010754 [Tulasnella sp. 418]|nr:hypothetical protein FRC02_010754 [Tulasnella sp. 418]
MIKFVALSSDNNCFSSIEARMALRQENGRCVLNGFPPEHDFLKRPSNEASPIQRLPYEILSDIMLECVEDERMPSRGIITIRLASVCFRWHQIVHTSHQIWAYLEDSMGTDKVFLFLAKSGEAPLTINCGRWDREFIDLIAPCIHRWKSFTFSESLFRFRDLSSLDMAKLFSKGPAPLLETLLLPPWRPRSSDPTIKLLDGKAPRLQDLRANSFSFDWSAPPSFNFTCLDLSAPASEPGYAEKYYHLLSASPNLEFLRIKGRDSGEDMRECPFIPPPHQTFYLRHLKNLILRWISPQVIGLLLSSIKATEDPNVMITDNHFTHHGPSSDLMLQSPLLPETIFPSALSQARTLLLYSTDELVDCVGISKSFDTSKAFDSSNSEHINDDEICAALELDGSTTQAILLFRTLFAIPTRLSQITGMSISGAVFFPDTSSFSFITHLTELSNLHLRECKSNVNAFIDFFSTGSHSGMQAFEPPCRKLRKLCFDKVTGYNIDTLVDGMSRRYRSMEQTSNAAVQPLDEFEFIEGLDIIMIPEVMDRLHAIFGYGICSWKRSEDDESD